MKFPYGVADFRKIIARGYFYCDRTKYIPILEDTGDYLLFLRPRRFGKSLLLSVLENYYDIAGKDEFDRLFGHLEIAEHPTSLRSSFFILRWDFSCVDPSGSAEDIKKSLHGHINSCVRSFSVYYEKILPRKILINPDDAIMSVRSLIDAVLMTPYRIYLLIDEYDNFANEVMMGFQRDKGVYEAVVYSDGPLKTLFKAVKALSGESGFSRIFITGVSPVVMSDITSGFNIAKNIYLYHNFNDLCGFTETEISDILKKIAEECGFDEQDVVRANDMMRTYYNGYIFAPDSQVAVYNPTLAIYFIEMFNKDCKYPRQMLDANLATDDAKLQYVSEIPGGRQLLLDIVNHGHQMVIPDLADRFGVSQMTDRQSKDNTFIASFLYFFGVLTIEKQTELNELILRVPNLVMYKLYIERIQRMLLPEPADRDDGMLAAKCLFGQGNMQPLCEFVEQRFFKVFHNRDYRWANELTVKTAFMTLLYNDILYIMDSEKTAGRGYADLVMMLRPDMRQYKAYDILIEFKFVTLKQAGLTAEQALALSDEQLRKITQEAMDSAKKQVGTYGNILAQKYKNLRLRRYAVVSLGFERICWEEQEEV